MICFSAVTPKERLKMASGIFKTIQNNREINQMAENHNQDSIAELATKEGIVKL